MLRIVRTETRSIEVTGAIRRAVFDLLRDESTARADAAGDHLGLALGEIEQLFPSTPELAGVLDRTLGRHGAWDYERLAFDLFD